MSDQPLVDAWTRGRARRMHPLQVSGHKNQYADGPGELLPGAIGADLLGPLVRDDLAMQGGVDDNAFSNGYLADAERLWASAVRADYCRFLVGGSTQGNISALSAIARPGRPVAIDRTSHRSTQAALVVTGALPQWIFPDIHPDFGLPMGIRADSIDGVVDDITGAFITSPSYVGTLSDVAALAEAAHRRGVPLVVDQAWGAHLGFLPGRGALELGADICVTSVHKALMGYTQTAVVAMRDGLVDRSQFDRCVDLVQTTSPSGTLLASIDATRAVLERDGTAAFERTFAAVQRMRRALAAIPGLVVLDDELVPHGMDPFKVTLWLPRTGADGVAIGQQLWDAGHGAESADRDTLVLTVTLVDSDAFLDEATALVQGLIEHGRGAPRAPAQLSVWQVEPEVACTPREAFFARHRRIRLDDAVGEISAEQFCPYPPGVPMLAPGERVTAEVIEGIRQAAREVRVAYCSDPSLETIVIVDES